MKKRTLAIIWIGLTLLLCTGYSNKAFAEVNINVGISVPPPPPFVIPAPPPVFVIPQTYVYFVPDIEVDILFYHGYWYRPYQGRWYRSNSHNGPWVYIIPEKLPSVLVRIPPNFRRVPPGHQRIPYGQLKKNWSKWEKEKYWDKYEPEKGRGEGHGGEKWEHEEGKGRSKGKH
jgi:hypothetical protein